VYIQSQFEEVRLPILHALIQRHPLATFIVAADGDIQVDHLPLILVDRGNASVLQGHIPRANHVWRLLDGSTAATAVFQGPQAYITPSWYPGKREHGRVVPTWNYAVVHVCGHPQAVEDGDWLLQHLNALTDQQERGTGSSWQVADAPAEFTETLMKGIVGIEMPVSLISGKWKVSQNRSPVDRRGVADGLRTQGEAGVQMAELVAAGISESPQDGGK